MNGCDNNLFLEGDNLIGLQELMKTHEGGIDFIYVDPPYNSGKQFIYSDKFSSGDPHEEWLSMLRPRMELARSLMSDNGLIFVHIDIREQPRMRILLEDIFKESNFVCEMIWKKGGTGKNNTRFAVVEHEYILVFAKDIRLAEMQNDSAAELSTKYNLEDENGQYMLVRLDMQSLQYSSARDYDLTGPDGTVYKLKHKNPDFPNAVWRWSKERVEKDMDQLVFHKGSVYTKNYKKEGARPRSLLVGERFGVTRTGKSEIEEVMPLGRVFSYPKPVRLIEYLIEIGTKKDSIVLDFFAGSGTTAHATMRLNAKDGGKRRFIMIQLDEEIDKKSEAYSEGYSTISQLCAERIRLAGQKLLDTNHHSDWDREVNFTKRRLGDSE